MTAPVCPRCRKEIPAADVNVAADVAFCRSCNAITKLSELLADDGPPFDASAPPPGAWAETGPAEMRLGASHRSIASALGLFVAACFWNGIVSVFVLIATASTLSLLGIPAPAWFPAPKIEGKGMGPGITIFLWLFLTPFIAVGLGLFYGVLQALLGKTEIRLSPSHVSVFAGIGPLGWSRVFDPREVKEVRYDDRRWQDSDGDPRRKTSGVIVLRSGREIPFGTGLRADRLRFLISGLRSGLRTLSS